MIFNHGGTESRSELKGEGFSYPCPLVRANDSNCTTPGFLFGYGPAFGAKISRNLSGHRISKCTRHQYFAGEPASRINENFS